METDIRLTTVDWLSRVIIRHLGKEDLPDLEWDGEYTHFRRVYSDTHERACKGFALNWVVELENIGIIGQVFIQLKCDRPELADGNTRVYMHSFRIKPAFRQSGLGSKLLQVIEEDVHLRGFQFMTLNVALDNVTAQRLYKRNGYKIIAYEPGQWSYPDHHGIWQNVNEPAWRMEKDISAAYK